MWRNTKQPLKMYLQRSVNDMKKFLGEKNQDGIISTIF